MHIFSKFSSFFLCCLFVANHSFAQGLSVNATGSAADTSAMLDVSSTSKGMLAPRMTTAQRNAIALPATGLMIYQTDGTAGFYYYTGSAWGVVGGSSLPTGIAGDVLYTDGSNWVASGTGTSGQTLMLVSGVPTWVTFPFYYISATSSTNGTVSPAGIKILSPGASQVYSITPSSGYVVGSLTVDGSSVSVVPTYTFTSVGASHTISASFVPTYNIVASSGANGTVTPTGTTVVTSGSSRAYTITPSAGYYVATVTVDGSSVGAVSTYTFTSVGASHTISASFAIYTYSLTASSGANGTVTPTGTTVVSYGGSQVYSMTPSSGYVVGSLTVDGSSVSVVPTYTFTSVGASHTISASFVVTPSVGASYGGGKLAYILVSGDPGYSSTTVHGLIAATSDQSTAALWYNGTYTVTGATGTAVGSGLSNTMAIIANQGAGSYAAQLCHAYTGGGYTDWYLPSKDELNKLYINQTAIGGFASGSYCYYWSSSEDSYGSAVGQLFFNGYQAYLSKSSPTYVRAVRAF